MKKLVHLLFAVTILFLFCLSVSTKACLDNCPPCYDWDDLNEDDLIQEEECFEACDQSFCCGYPEGCRECCGDSQCTDPAEPACNTLYYPDKYTCVECDGDDHCASNPVNKKCNLVDYTCVECLNDPHCVGNVFGEFCVNGLCRECRDDSNCGECGICDATYHCYYGYEADLQCSGCQICDQGDCIDSNEFCGPCGECQNGSCVPIDSVCDGGCRECQNVGPKTFPGPGGIPVTVDPYYECVYECTEGTCCDTSKDECAEVSEWNPGFSLSIDIPDAITGAINSAVNAIPKVNDFELEEAEITATGNIRDCCDSNGVFNEDGEYEISGSVTLAVELGEIEVWDKTIEKEWDFWNNTYSFSAGAEVDISIDSSVNITGGKRANECVEEECLFGSVGVNIGVTGEATVGAKICKNITDPSCDTCDGCCVDLGVNATVTGAISGSVTYNETDCDDDVEGDISVGVDAEIKIKVGCIPDLKWEIEII